MLMCVHFSQIRILVDVFKAVLQAKSRDAEERESSEYPAANKAVSIRLPRVDSSLVTLVVFLHE